MIKEFCDNCRKEIKSAPLRNVIVYTDSFLDAAGSIDTYEHAFCLCATCARDFNNVMQTMLNKDAKPQVNDIGWR